jgi:hypothetical protein
MVVLAGCGLWEVPEVSDVPPIDTVAVQVVRFDTGGLVSTGVPLARGLLRDADSVRLVIDGAEVPMYVEPLVGRHADGSYRSVLVQFPWTSDSARGVLEFGVVGKRLETKTPVRWLLESAVILPTSVDYILGTGILPPTVASAQMPATPLSTEYDRLYKRWSAHHRVPNVMSPWGSRRLNYYDRVLSSFAQWARTGEVGYWLDAAKLARHYQAPNVLYNHHEFQPDGLYANYLLTGDDRSQSYLVRWASRMATFHHPSRNYAYWWDRNQSMYLEGRIQQRHLLGVLYAGFLGDESRDWIAYADAMVQSWLDIQEPHFAGVRTQQTSTNGSWHYGLDAVAGADPFGQSNFMEGLRVTALVTYLEMRRPGPDMQRAVERAIQRNVDDLWATQWQPEFHAFRYETRDLPGMTDTKRRNFAEINNLMVLGFAYTYHVTGDVTYRDRALAVMSPAFTAPGGWLPWWQGHNGKIFNQNYYSSWRALYYLHVPPRLEP